MVKASSWPLSSLSPRLYVLPYLLSYLPRHFKTHARDYFQGHWARSIPWNPKHAPHPFSVLSPEVHPPRSLLPDAHSAGPLTPEDLHALEAHPARPLPVLWLSPPRPSPRPSSEALIPGLPVSLLALLMLMEVSIPGRRLKPPSSIKAGSSCPCTITLAPVTVDSSGMKSFCSVRSVRDRPGGCGGNRVRGVWEKHQGVETHPPTHPPCLVSKPPRAASSGRPAHGFGNP